MTVSPSSGSETTLKPTDFAAVPIAAVVLTYNSADDLPQCLIGLAAQRGVDLRVVVVDNNSHPDARAFMESKFLEFFPDGAILSAGEKTPPEVRHLFLRNDKNSGYSSGNNIGARLAVEAGCDAILIVNPDVRLSDAGYMAGLWQEMRQYPDCAVGASRILSLKGINENPLRELGFWEELFWFRQYLPGPLRPPAYVPQVSGNGPVRVGKLHGCCLMVLASFLEEIGYLDDTVFLYSEEPILAAQVCNAGKRLMLFPRLTAVHAHVASTKGNSSRRMLTCIRSRLYYLSRYSGYGAGTLTALRLSYRVLWLLHFVKAQARTDRSANSKRKDSAA